MDPFDISDLIDFNQNECNNTDDIDDGYAEMIGQHIDQYDRTLNESEAKHNQFVNKLVVTEHNVQNDKLIEDYIDKWYDVFGSDANLLFQCKFNGCCDHMVYSRQCIVQHIKTHFRENQFNTDSESSQQKHQTKQSNNCSKCAEKCVSTPNLANQ